MLEALYLVRHATPDRSLKMPYNIHPGPPLTPFGQHEAAETAEWLLGRDIEHVFASPFERASATAGVLAERLEVDLTASDLLREGGPGEPLEQIRARVAELLAQIDDSPLRRVALVTHGACIHMLLKHTAGDQIDLSRHRYDNGNTTPTSGVWHGMRSEAGWRWELVFRPGPERKAEEREPLNGGRIERQEQGQAGRDNDWATV